MKDQQIIQKSITWFVFIIFLSCSLYAQNDTLFQVVSKNKFKTAEKCKRVFDKIDTFKVKKYNYLILKYTGIRNNDSVTLYDAKFYRSNTNIGKIYNTREILNGGSIIKSHGAFSTYPNYETGEIRVIWNLNNPYVIEDHLKNGMLNGAHTEYYSNGSLKVQGNYIENARQGKWNYYHPNGQIGYTGKYKPKVLIFAPHTDDSINVFAKGNKSLGVITYDSFNYIIRTFYKQTNANVIPTNIFFPIGTWRYYNEQGILIRKEKYRHGIRNGKWKYYDNNGKLAKEGYFKNNFYIKGDFQNSNCN